MCDQPGQAKGKHAVLFLRGKNGRIVHLTFAIQGGTFQHFVPAES